MSDTPPTQAEMVEIVYTNHRGETSRRRIRPIELRFESSQWHVEPQWILHAFDYDKQAVRFFAMQDVKAWGPPTVVGEGTEYEPLVAWLDAKST